MAKPALGRGLGALLGGTSPVDISSVPALSAQAATPPVPAFDGLERVDRVPLGRIRPCPFQPRKEFEEEALRELADSIREQGIVQPLVVRRRGDDYELIAGERRWRAAQLAKLEAVPVLIREADDRQALELALIENLQRENLNPLEEAHGYQQLMEQFQLRQEDVALKVGKNRASVANALRLLKLPPDVQAYIRSGHLSVGHAKVILGLSNFDYQRLAADRVIRQSLNVRQTEDLIARLQGGLGSSRSRDSIAGSKANVVRDVHVAALETRLQERLGTKVQVRYRQGKGSLEVKFFSDEELERILNLLGVGAE